MQRHFRDNKFITHFSTYTELFISMTEEGNIVKTITE